MSEPNIEKMKAKRDVEGLLKALKDERWGVRQEAVRALGKIGDARAIVTLLEYLFANFEDIKCSLGEKEIWVRALHKLAPNSTVTKQIMRDALVAAGYDYIYWAEDISLKRSDAAVRRLCEIESPVTSNLLWLISKKRNIRVTLATGCEDSWEKVVDFSRQRQMATDELVRRGSPPYDPSAFLKSSEQKG